MVVALCAAAMLALGGVATAQAQGLTTKAAKKLAKKLAEQQVQGRDVISYHLFGARRLGSNRVVFLYDDRTREHVYCTAAIVVTRSTVARRTTTRARFVDQDCAGIPAEVRAFEAATRRAQRALRANSRSTLRALIRLERNLQGCTDVLSDAPRSRRDEVDLLLGVAGFQAIVGPNAEQLTTFVSELAAVDAQNARLAAGSAAWVDFLEAVAALPVVDDPCAMLRQWARSQWVGGAAPVDFAAIRAFNRRLTTDSRTIRRAATYMASRGAYPNAAVGFSVAGILAETVGGAGLVRGGVEVDTLGKALVP
jgi:hypothetical protein